MRWLLLFLSLIAPTPVCAKVVVYVSLAGERKIAVYSLDEDGKLAHMADTPVPGEPAALTTDPARKFLFASLRPEGKLTSFRIDPRTGKLTAVSVVDAGADPAQVTTDREGKVLFTAYYVAAKVTVHKIGPKGELGEKPDQTIMTAEKAHAIVPDATNRFVFVPHTGPNAIFQFAFDAKTGRLTPATPAKLVTGKGTGPRHLVFHPTKPIAYGTNEQGGSVSVYVLDAKGMLKRVQTVSTLPADFRETNATAEIRIHPGGKFLYAANRGHESIAVFALDSAGKLTSLGQEPTEKTPRSFDLDPTGKFLIAAGESSGKLACYRIAKTGKLKRYATVNVGKIPWWVLAVELPAK